MTEAEELICYQVAREQYGIDCTDDLVKWLDKINATPNYFNVTDPVLVEVAPDGRNKAAYLIRNADGSGHVITQELYHLVENFGSSLLERLIPISEKGNITEPLRKAVELSDNSEGSISIEDALAGASAAVDTMLRMPAKRRTGGAGGF
ncbi:MAG: hypothetical protein WCP20_17570 [Desulfuromonadales bacterium]